MRISTRVEYGLAALIDIAYYATPTNRVSVPKISNRQNIPSKYLEQVMNPLQQAHLIIGTKGAGGGYVLGRPAKLITMSDVLKILDSSIINRYYEERTHCDTTMKEVVNNILWSSIEDNIVMIANSITLDMLVMRYREQLAEGSVMFFI